MAEQDLEEDVPAVRAVARVEEGGLVLGQRGAEGRLAREVADGGRGGGEGGGCGGRGFWNPRVARLVIGWRRGWAMGGRDGSEGGAGVATGGLNVPTALRRRGGGGWATVGMSQALKATTLVVEV